jgi:hypothetical protein
MAGHGGVHLSFQLHGKAYVRITIQASPAVKQDATSKINTKRVGRVTQVVEHLPIK